jgi:hypothetical protein
LNHSPEKFTFLTIRRIMLIAILAIVAVACSSSGSDSGSDDINDDDDTNDVTPTPTRAGDILFSELMADPDVLLDTIGEWIEIQNPTTGSLNLIGCVVSVANTSNFVIGIDVEIPAGEYLTFASSLNPGFVPDFVYSGGLTLSNVADTITLTCNGVTIDLRNYTMTAGGQSSALSNDGSGKWCIDQVNFYNGDRGTPGAANGNCP